MHVISTLSSTKYIIYLWDWDRHAFRGNNVCSMGVTWNDVIINCVIEFTSSNCQAHNNVQQCSQPRVLVCIGNSVTVEVSGKSGLS